MEKYRSIEKSIIKKYRRKIWSKFVKGIKEYDLLKPNDKIAVCISGGKDSFLLAKCMQELQRHGIFKFDLEFIVMNPGYTKEGLDAIKKNAELLNIPIKIFESDIFNEIEGEDSPCYVCARKRRGHLYHFAQELGCNKIALGHHYDDVCETILLSIIYGGEVKTMLPKLHSDHYQNMDLIRPLYLVHEIDIKSWMNYNELEFINCCCPMASYKKDSKRAEIKELISNLRRNNQFTESNIFRSVENVNLNMILGYNKGSTKYNFLDDYDKKGK